MNTITTPINGIEEWARGMSPTSNTVPNTSYCGMPSPTYSSDMSCRSSVPESSTVYIYIHVRHIRQTALVPIIRRIHISVIFKIRHAYKCYYLQVYSESSAQLTQFLSFIFQVDNRIQPSSH